ncbi:MAG: hypothetical protein AAB803_00240 [Patescibacteria group bacterium]
MSVLALDALLLFVLSVPVVMRYRILPIEGTPYWLFGILFLILITNVLVSLYPGFFKKTIVLKAKLLFLMATLAIVVGGTTVTAIVDRSRTAPVYNVHDIILQQEAAMRYLLQGKNPYKETYFGTFLEEWHYAEGGKDAVNPALYHFVMPPWYLIFAFPFYFISTPVVGFFDGRMPLLFALTGLLFVIYRWLKDKNLASAAVVLTALSPATIDYFIEGRSDMFALFWLVWALYLLDKRKFIISSLLFGLAVLSKQTTWFMFPLYAVFGWLLLKRSIGKTILLFIPALMALMIVAGPFLLWDAKAFIDSTVLYLSGNSVHSYPISGYGLGMLLYEAGVIKDMHAHYPFILWQITLGLPVLGAVLWYLVKKPVMSRLLVGYGVVLLVFWYMSRYLNNSHVGFISSIFALGVLKDWDEKTT